MQNISPFIWLDHQAEQAAAFYASVFRKSRIAETRRWGEGGPAPAGSVMSVTVELDGLELILFNGGPHYKVSPAVSFFAKCQTQDEVDHLWNALVEGGWPQQCGWLTDRFGVTWQIVPTLLGELLADPDRGRSTRAVAAMMKMVKLDIAELQRAADAA